MRFWCLSSVAVDWIHPPKVREMERIRVKVSFFKSKSSVSVGKDNVTLTNARREAAAAAAAATGGTSPPAAEEDAARIDVLVDRVVTVVPSPAMMQTSQVQNELN